LEFIKEKGKYEHTVITTAKAYNFIDHGSGLKISVTAAGEIVNSRRQITCCRKVILKQID
jgi:hypothetical protein